ncbi:MAG TPA: peroxiredoxin, partial [Candidatus Dormibacteraeota bacterium]|nr:peroxiredoxin [Candidatus Dormibacteraeota bacterium]
SLSKLLGKGAVLLVFYPGDDTPVCTKQLCNYRDNLGVFGEMGVQVVAINPQSVESHRGFADKHKLPFAVVADSGGKVCRQYGALNFLGMAKRALVLIGKDGRIKWRRTDFPIFHQTAEDVRKAVAGLV